MSEEAGELWSNRHGNFNLFLRKVKSVNGFGNQMIRIFCLILTVALFDRAYGATEKWSNEVIGEAFLEGSMTAVEAQELCVNRAKAKAIEEVAGTSILREVFVIDYMKIAEFIHAQTNAWVKEVKIIKWDDPTGFQKALDSPPVIMLRVHLKALVVFEKEVNRDFSVKLTLNEDLYRDGDEMLITIRATMDCYLTVFNIMHDNKVMVLVPSKYQAYHFAKKGMTYTIPDKETMGNQRRVRTYNTTDMPSVRESIFVIATRHDLNLIEDNFKTADLSEQGTSSGSFRDLLGKMVSIPPNDRAMAIHSYEIRGKGRK